MLSTAAQKASKAMKETRAGQVPDQDSTACSSSPSEPMSIEESQPTQMGKMKEGTGLSDQAQSQKDGSNEDAAHRSSKKISQTINRQDSAFLRKNYLKLAQAQQQVQRKCQKSLAKIGAKVHRTERKLSMLESKHQKKLFKAQQRGLSEEQGPSPFQQINHLKAQKLKMVDIPCLQNKLTLLYQTESDIAEYSQAAKEALERSLQEFPPHVQYLDTSASSTSSSSQSSSSSSSSSSSDSDSDSDLNRAENYTTKRNQKERRRTEEHQYHPHSPFGRSFPGPPQPPASWHSTQVHCYPAGAPPVCPPVPPPPPPPPAAAAFFGHPSRHHFYHHHGHDYHHHGPHRHGRCRKGRRGHDGWSSNSHTHNNNGEKKFKENASDNKRKGEEYGEEVEIVEAVPTPGVADDQGYEFVSVEAAAAPRSSIPQSHPVRPRGIDDVDSQRSGLDWPFNSSRFHRKLERKMAKAQHKIEKRMRKFERKMQRKM